MIGKTIASLMLALFVLTNSTFATNWLYLRRLEGTRYGPCIEYVDADSVIGDTERVAVF